MNKKRFALVGFILALSFNQAALGDSAAPAKDAHAAPTKDAHAAPVKDAHAAPGKDAHAAPVKDAHAASSADHGAAPADAAATKDEPKPVAQKPKRKKAKAKAKAEAKADPKGHGSTKDGADHHADGAPSVPAEIAPTTRVRTRDRAAAASAVAAEQSTATHDAHKDDHAPTPANAKADSHGTAPDTAATDHHAAPAVPAKHDTTAAKAADAHHADAPPAVPANIEPTQRQRVRSSAAAKQDSLAAAPHSGTATSATAHAADAHGKAPHAAHDSAGHDAKHGSAHDNQHDPTHAAKETDAHSASAHGSDACNPPLKAEIAALFDRWNASLRTGDPRKVVANYAPDSVLLPTVSNRARFTIAEKEDYFMHFLQRRPQGYIDDRIIDVDCNSATDAGLYTFRFSDGSSVKARYSFTYKKINGQWLITSHHSSGMPEKPEAHAAAGADAHSAPKAPDAAGSTKGWVRFP